MATLDDLQKRHDELSRRMGEILDLCHGDLRGPLFALPAHYPGRDELQAEHAAIKSELGPIAATLRRYHRMTHQRIDIIPRAGAVMRRARRMGEVEGW